MPIKENIMHFAYHDREDLRHLARCNNINGPICPTGLVTTDRRKVTCKRCLRIMRGEPIRRTGGES